MSLFSDNLKCLRNKRNLTQRTVAAALEISRDRYAKYEDGVNSPPLEMLVNLSHYHNISIDVLLSVDLKKISLNSLLKLENNRILLPITVDKNGNNNVELIPHKAKAGYRTGYADAEFIENLQHLVLPFLGPGKYRAFPIDGDSMPPFENGTFIVGKYIERSSDLLVDKTYIFLTKDEGIIYKRLNKIDVNGLTLASDNVLYKPYVLEKTDILEIWEYQCNIGRSDHKQDITIPNSVKDMLLELKTIVGKIV